MSTFATALAIARQAILGVFGESVVYHAAGGGVVDIATTAAITRGASEGPEDASPYLRALCSLADLTAASINPAIGDEIILAEGSYRVRDVRLEREGGGVTLSLEAVP